MSHAIIAEVLREQGHTSAALEALQAALAIRTRLTQARPENSKWQRDLTSIQDRLGDVLSEAGKEDQALPLYRAALATRERLVAESPDTPSRNLDLAFGLLSVGALLIRRGDSREGREMLRRCGQLYAAFGSTMYHSYNGACCHALAGDSDEAFVWLVKAVAQGYRKRDSMDRDPDLATLRTDARWKPLLKNMPGK